MTHRESTDDGHWKNGWQIGNGQKCNADRKIQAWYVAVLISGFFLIYTF